MSSILSSVEGGVIGVAVGEGAAAAVEPVVEPAKQEVWHANPFRVLDPSLLAELVVQRLTDFASAQDQAQRSGFDKNPFRAMVEATFKAPGTPEALELWRRGRIGPNEMKHALRKAGLEEQWLAPILELFGERLDPAIIANAIQQGFLANNNVLPKPTPPKPDWIKTDGPFSIPVEEVQLLDTENKPVTPEQEAEASGISFQRLQVEAELSGNPPGEETLLDMWRRGILGAAGYATGLREGRTKTKWTAALSARFWQLLPPTVLVNLRLRGWIEDPAYHERMALHGYRPEQAQDWYDSSGRPATTHQALVGTRRGGIYDGPLTGIPDYFVKAVRQSNIKPEWTHILYHGRETFPSAFVLRLLTTRGDITGAQAHDLLYQNGWPDWLATAVSSAWVGTTAGAPTDPAVKSAHTRAVTLLRNAYVARRIEAPEVQTRRSELDTALQAADPLVAVWDVMRSIPGAGLTRAQVKKAFKSLPAEWPRDRALTELEDLGMEPEEAQTFLDE